ncbi:hypothetical protein [Streptomyces albipurpureus]|uniref:Neocarzinostatin family protein n=1 Tax=Streptomyces albipurpureus TaxID=2897419 RepID=A0ABT0V007_9ACTN|nr:hypothetical protein [Streptomyces sp. CWNU-1]MCM2394007.1 hypothetical protein [Streptomyces sp. CWNU-1]
MSGKRKVVLTVSAVLAAGVMVIGTGAAQAGAGDAAPEADVAHHGHISLVDGQLRVSLASKSHGPVDVADSTVRIGFSGPLAAAQQLPPGCLWAADQEMLCATGPLRAGADGQQDAFTLSTTGTPEEMVVTIATQWNGGAVDHNPTNHEHEVLVPATGDLYVF